MPKTPSTSKFLTIAEVAESCRVPISTVRWWIHRKRLSSHKVGRKRLIAHKDLEAFLDGCREEAL